MARSPSSLPAHVFPFDWAYQLGKYFYTRWYYKKADVNKAAPEKPEVIGVKDPVLVYKVDGNDKTGWSSSLDTTSRPGKVKIAITNASGGAGIVTGAAVRGYPIRRFSGDLGHKHDSHNDYDDINRNGERAFEFGNNFICTKTQLEQLADYYWKLMRDKKHLYVIALSGTRYWFEPGEWYTLQVGGAGQVEYIDATVECYDVQIERGADIGQTVVAFREVEQNWVFDSNAVARFIACGSPQAIPRTEGVISVASSDYLGAADFYCDGTSDEDEINAAIDLAASLAGGGEVRLLGGTFYIDATIAIDGSVSFDCNGATISKNSDDDAINITADNVNLRNGTLIRTDTNDSPSNNGIVIGTDLVSQSNITIDNMIITDCGGSGIEAHFTDNGIVANCRIDGAYTNGIFIVSGIATQIINNFIVDCNGWGVSLDQYSSASVYGNQMTGCVSGGVYLANTDRNEPTIVSGNKIWECGQLTPDTTLPIGIKIIASVDDSFISGNMSTLNGTIVSFATCENDTYPPKLDGNSADNTTVARSDTVAYAGTYSYKITKAVAAGTAAAYRLTDNANTDDQHGFIDGLSYRVSCMVYVPSTGGPAAAEVFLRAHHYTAGWTTVTDAATGQDAWEELTLDVTMGGSMTGAYVDLYFAATAADTEFFYIDNVRVVPLGLGNDHSTNYSDSGTGTVASGNSWQ